jgi:hypothetical protein
MAAAEIDRYDLVSLGPDAAGWRAVANGTTIPVIAWGVFRWTKRRKSDGSLVEDLGTIMAGVVADSHPGGPAGGFLCAAGLLRMDGYLSPQMPDPAA